MSVKQIVLGAAAISSTSALQFTSNSNANLRDKCSSVLDDFLEEAERKKVGMKDEETYVTDGEQIQRFYAVMRASQQCAEGKVPKSNGKEVKPAYLKAEAVKDQGALNEIMKLAKEKKTFSSLKKRAEGAEGEPKIGDRDFDYFDTMQKLMGNRVFARVHLSTQENRFSDSFYMKCCVDIAPEEREAAAAKAAEEKKKEDEARAKEEQEAAAEKAKTQEPEEAAAKDAAAAKAKEEEGCCR